MLTVMGMLFVFIGSIFLDGFSKKTDTIGAIFLTEGCLVLLWVIVDFLINLGTYPY